MAQIKIPNKNGDGIEILAKTPPIIGPKIVPILMYDAFKPKIVPWDFSSVSFERIVCISGFIKVFASAKRIVTIIKDERLLVKKNPM